MSFLKVVIFGYPFFKFQGSKKLLGDTTLSRGWFLNNVLNAHPDPWEMKSAYFGRNRAWIHKSQKILSLSNWCSVPETRLLRNLCCNFSRWWQLKYVFISTPIPGEMIQFDEHGFSDAEMLWLPAISRLLLCCNPPGAGERRKCVTCPGFFSWNANGEWTEVIADPPKKKTGLVTRLFSFLTNSLGVFWGRTSI